MIWCGVSLQAYVGLEASIVDRSAFMKDSVAPGGDVEVYWVSDKVEKKGNGDAHGHLDDTCNGRSQGFRHLH